MKDLTRRQLLAGAGAVGIVTLTGAEALASTRSRSALALRPVPGTDALLLPTIAELVRDRSNVWSVEVGPGHTPRMNRREASAIFPMPHVLSVAAPLPEADAAGWYVGALDLAMDQIEELHPGQSLCVHTWVNPWLEKFTDPTSCDDCETAPVPDGQTYDRAQGRPVFNNGRITHQLVKECGSCEQAFIYSLLDVTVLEDSGLAKARAWDLGDQRPKPNDPRHPFPEQIRRPAEGVLLKTPVPVGAKRGEVEVTASEDSLLYLSRGSVSA